jgi:hypothetical protein
MIASKSFWVRYLLLNSSYHYKGATVHPVTKDALVSIEAFADTLEWFGPVKDGAELMSKIYSLSTKPWFFGSTSKAEAEMLLARPKITEGRSY